MSATRTDEFGFGSLDWVGLIGFMALTHVVGALGTVDVRIALRSDWYKKLKRVSVPNWLFGVMWTILYTLMAVSVFLVWQDNAVSYPKLFNPSIALWVGLLFFNAIWSPLFFGAQAFGVALADVIMQLLLAIGVTVLFFMQNIAAGALMIPLCAWLCFAAYLNAYVVLHNRVES